MSYAQHCRPSPTARGREGGPNPRGATAIAPDYSAKGAIAFPFPATPGGLRGEEVDLHVVGFTVWMLFIEGK